MILILTYWLGWLSLSDWYAESSPEPSTKVSIIVPARNEAINIENCLQSILSQKYNPEKMEVILVNDFSEDDTLQIAQSINDDRLKIIDLKDYQQPSSQAFKKFGIQTAISQAKGDLIITTDADCYVGENWLKSMVSYYEQKDFKLITGPVVINCKNKVLEIFQAIDFLGMMGLTGASLNFKLSNMANGANLAYEKRVFQEVGGFQGIDDIASGDDMLLMKKILDRYPNSAGFVKNKNAVVYTKAESNVKDFLNQRIRWASKSSRYKDWKIVSILFVGLLFYLSLFVNFSLCLSGSLSWNILLYQIGLKLIVDFVFLHLIASYFKKQICCGFLSHFSFSIYSILFMLG